MALVSVREMEEQGGIRVVIFPGDLFGSRCRGTEGAYDVLRSLLSAMIASPAVASTRVHQVEEPRGPPVFGQGSRELRRTGSKRKVEVHPPALEAAGRDVSA